MDALCIGDFHRPGRRCRVAGAISDLDPQKRSSRGLPAAQRARCPPTLPGTCYAMVPARSGSGPGRRRARTWHIRRPSEWHTIRTLQPTYRSTVCQRALPAPSSPARTAPSSHRSLEINLVRGPEQLCLQPRLRPFAAASPSESFPRCPSSPVIRLPPLPVTRIFKSFETSAAFRPGPHSPLLPLLSCSGLCPAPWSQGWRAEAPGSTPFLPSRGSSHSCRDLVMQNHQRPSPT